MNILIIGTGYHARRIYIPYIIDTSSVLGIHQIFGLDLTSQKVYMTEWLKRKGYQGKIDMAYIEDAKKEDNIYIQGFLRDFILLNNIQAVIISTEPLSHLIYIHACLQNNVSILLDKPITLEKDIVNDPRKADKIRYDYAILKNLYLEKCEKHKLHFDVMAQRRYHQGYKFVLERLKEVTGRCNIGVTSSVSFHNDGMWRTPSEYIDMEYHPYNQGYGKLGHSGFHTIDLVGYLIKHSTPSSKRTDSIETFATSIHPKDVYTQFDYSDYENIFGKDFSKFRKYSPDTFLQQTKTYGDIDLNAIIKFKKSEYTTCVSSINLGHNGFSQRGWLNTEGKDLYKGNGRVRHEFHIFEQGPFQSILIESFQSQELGKEGGNINSHETGGEQHFTVHIFRNSTLFPDWKNYECITAKELYDSMGSGYTRGHNEEARRDGVRLFFENINHGNTKEHSLSNICDHDYSIELFASIYKSISHGRSGGSPVVINPIT